MPYYWCVVKMPPVKKGKILNWRRLLYQYIFENIFARHRYLCNDNSFLVNILVLFGVSILSLFQCSELKTAVYQKGKYKEQALVTRKQ